MKTGTKTNFWNNNSFHNALGLPILFPTSEGGSSSSDSSDSESETPPTKMKIPKDNQVAARKDTLLSTVNTSSKSLSSEPAPGLLSTSHTTRPAKSQQSKNSRLTDSSDSESEPRPKKTQISTVNQVAASKNSLSLSSDSSYSDSEPPLTKMKTSKVHQVAATKDTSSTSRSTSWQLYIMAAGLLSTSAFTQSVPRTVSLAAPMTQTSSQLAAGANVALPTQSANSLAITTKLVSETVASVVKKVVSRTRNLSSSFPDCSPVKTVHPTFNPSLDSGIN